MGLRTMVGPRSKLVVVEEEPFNAETPMEALAEPLTPNFLFYVRNHFGVPRLEAETWRLAVDGAVENSLDLSLEDLKGLPRRMLTVTLECAGNGRTMISPVPAGTPWCFGAVSTATFTGTPLRTILDKAKLHPEAKEILFVGADQGEVEPGRMVRFARSLSCEIACHPDTLLAWAMNDEPLTPDHGFPLRLVVPKWYGVASVKWLERITAMSGPFNGYYQTERYVYLGERGTSEATPVTVMRVRSIIGRPLDGANLPLAPLEVAGTAWSGAGQIVRVEVSADEGRSWTEAELRKPPSPYAATPWRFSWTPPARGDYTLIARATDSVGNSQPLSPPYDKYGYGCNVVHRIQVTVS